MVGMKQAIHTEVTLRFPMNLVKHHRRHTESE